MHVNLSRQLAELGIRDPSDPPDRERWIAFIDAVDGAYANADRDIAESREAMASLSGEMKSMNSHLLEEHDRLKTIVAAPGSAIIVYEADGTVGLINDEADALLGPDPGTLDNLCSLVLSQTRERLGGRDFWTMDAACRQITIPDATLCRADGSEVAISCVLTPIIQQARPCGCVLAFKDMTERRELETQLIQAQKLESIGQMAAGIAHEINTPTQFVGDNVQFLKSSFEDLRDLLAMYRTLADDLENGNDVLGEVEALKSKCREIDIDYVLSEIPGAIEESMNGVGRVAAIVRAMKEFSHPGSDTKTDVDLNRAIESTATVARNEWKYVSDLALDLDPDLPPVPCVIGEFNQVILNMIVNSAHAIRDVVGDGSGGKGRILIATRLVGDRVRIRITDTGVGIPAKSLDRIFDPFYTTKEVGKGTGQGLAIARNVIVKKHGGSIDVESEPGRGTTFTIHLPMKSEQERAAA